VMATGIDQRDWPGDERPTISVLTARPLHPSVLALTDACAELGAIVRAGGTLDHRAAVVFQWSYNRLRVLAAIRRYCLEHNIELLNPHVLGKWQQWQRLSQAGLPVPPTRYVRTLEEGRAAARELGFPVILKPLYGLKSHGVELVTDDEELVRVWRPVHRLVQRYLTEGNRCARLLVVGSKLVHSVMRVALDGVHATYDHGRRGLLEPFPLAAEHADLAIAACSAVEVTVGGVDFVETTDGPQLLEVNHARVDLADEALHGPRAIHAVARLLVDKALARGPRVWEGRRRIRIVTGLRTSEAAKMVRSACASQGLAADIGSSTEPFPDCIWLWGLTSTHYRRAAAKVRAIGVPSVNGRCYTVAQQRGLLFRAGIRVPRARIARDLGTALSVAAEFGYPALLRRNEDPSERAPIRADSSEALRIAWTSSSRLVEEGRLLEAPVLRLWVAGERVYFAARRTGPHSPWRTIRLAGLPAATAVAACRALSIDLGIVELVAEADGETVTRVLARGVWINRLSHSRAEVALREIAGLLRHRLGELPPPSKPAGRRLRVLLARSFQKPGSHYRIPNIQAVYHELLRQGYHMIHLRAFDAKLVADADLILQDPMQAFGFSARGDELDDVLYEQAAQRSHLLRRLRSGTTDKRAMTALAKELGVRTPKIYEQGQVSADDLPVVLKPRRGSLGIGVQLVTTLEALEALARPDHILQQFINPKMAYVVSIRVVTVVDKVVAAALFYNSHAVCSNLAQGGRAVALTGPGRKVRPTREEAALLDLIGIDPILREVPDEVVRMATLIGRYHARNGAQTIGQDFVVDEKGRWYFLEVNMGFGTAVFNVTDGEGYPHNGRGMVHAGRVLAAEFVRQFTR
jgi:glutathione synthase/RimK-type ligase-like ATP-grasp enzyme